MNTPPAQTRFAAGLLAALLVICVVTFLVAPAGPTSWLLEVSPGLAMVAVLTAIHRRFPMSRFVYVCVFLHVCILIYGGMYTYAKTPLGNWVRDTFHLARNDYDRVGHLALGVFPVFLTREVLLRRTPLKRGAWLTFLLLCVILAIAAFWELLEWWVALLSSPETGNAFLATQGDIWDTQWDMFLALVGAVVALPLLSRLHDRSMRKLGVTA
jgi:putative membrane protein